MESLRKNVNFGLSKTIKLNGCNIYGATPFRASEQIKAFESRRTYRQIDTLHRRSPDPRVLSLRDLLVALA